MRTPGPDRDFWPLVPRPAVLPRPLPCPRPSRLLVFFAPSFGRRSSIVSGMVALYSPDRSSARPLLGRDLLDRDEMTHLPNHAANGRFIRPLHGVVELAQTHRADRALLIAWPADQTAHQGDPQRA